jgi:hypothetical protein
MRIVIVVVLLAAAPALAEDPPADPEVPSDEPTAADVAGAPLPGAESGRTDPPETDSTLRDIGQGVLLVPRVGLEVVMAPMRGALWALDHYELQTRFRRWFFDRSGTYGVYPTFVLDTSYGFTVGARFVDRNVFGKAEHFSVRVSTGGEYRFETSGALRSGYRFGKRTLVTVRGQFERRPEDLFFGIGNDTSDERVYHRQELVRGAATFDVRAIDGLHVRGAFAYTNLDYGDSNKGPAIDVVYNPMTLTGFETGIRNVYGEAELRWDSRQLPRSLDLHGLFDKGALLSIFGGRVHQFEAGGDYWTYGGEAQVFQRLGDGPRVVSARLVAAGVTGGYDDVAFTQLPQLGGKRFLRGYPADRFRDRLAVAGSVEYTWDLGRSPMASVFVDAGRVYHSPEDLTFDGLRADFGVSLQWHADRHYMAGVSVAASIDGEMFAYLTFDPVFDIEPRVEQR